MQTHVLILRFKHFERAQHMGMYVCECMRVCLWIVICSIELPMIVSWLIHFDFPIAQIRQRQPTTRFFFNIYIFLRWLATSISCAKLFIKFTHSNHSLCTAVSCRNGSFEFFEDLNVTHPFMSDYKMDLERFVYSNNYGSIKTTFTRYAML